MTCNMPGSGLIATYWAGKRSLKHGLDLHRPQLQVGVMGGCSVVQELLKALAQRQPGLRMYLCQGA